MPDIFDNIVYFSYKVMIFIIGVDFGRAPQVTLECLSYHATAALEDATKLSRRKIPSAAALKLHSFSFDDFSLSDEETLQVSVGKIKAELSV